MTLGQPYDCLFRYLKNCVVPRIIAFVQEHPLLLNGYPDSKQRVLSGCSTRISCYKETGPAERDFLTLTEYGDQLVIHILI